MLNRNDEPEFEREGCEVCQVHIEDCVCGECPVCKTAGDPECYGGKCSGITKVKYPEDLEGRKKFFHELDLKCIEDNPHLFSQEYIDNFLSKSKR